MSKHQKRILITNICVLSGIILAFLGIALMIIFGFCISDKTLSGKLILTAFLFVMIGLILLIIATRTNATLFPHFGYLRTHFLRPSTESFGAAGVPNNSFSEFDIPISKFLPEVLQVQEITKGVYEIKIDEQKYTFNMKGWIFKEYYIYEIILTKIQIKYMVKNKIKSLCQSLEIKSISNLRLDFLKQNGKKKSYMLIQDGKTKLYFRYKHNMKQKIIYFRNKKKISLNALYDFNV